MSKIVNMSARALAVLWIGLLCGSMATPLRGGEIRGRVLRQSAYAPPTEIVSRSIILRYASRQFESPHNGHAQHNENQVVVYLAGAPEAERAQPGVAIMDQRNEQFIPHVLPVTIGTAVDFLNSEAVYHNVFSLSPAKTFDLGRYPQGQSRRVRFDRPGVVSVYCDIHTHMNAFILVLPTSHFTVADGEGNFILENVPAGNFELRVWNGRAPEFRQQITVRENGVTEMNFVLP